MYLNKIAFVLLVLLSFQGQAQEARVEKPKSDGIEFSGRQDEDWMNVQNRLSNLKGKVESQQKIVEELIVKKNTVKGAELSKTLDQLSAAHGELLRLSNDFNTLNNDFQSRYPEKGANIGRIYKRVDPQSIQVIENRMTLEGRIKKVKDALKKQYPKSAPNEETDGVVKKSTDTKKSAKNKVEEQKNPEVQVTDQIIFEK